MTYELVPLPAPTPIGRDSDKWYEDRPAYGYTADQMHAYGHACAEAAKKEAADRIEALEAKVREQALDYLHLETGHELARQADEALMRQALEAMCDFDYDKRLAAIASLRKRLGEKE